MSPIPQKIITKSPKWRGLSPGYLVFGRIHMMDFGLGRPSIHVPKFYALTHPCTKIFCSKPPQLPILIKILLSNPSMYHKVMLKILQNPFMYQNFTIFWKMIHPSLYIFVSKHIHVHPLYVSKKIFILSNIFILHRK